MLNDRGKKKKNGAGNGTRTRDLHLGKVALYQLSYSRSTSKAVYFLMRGGISLVGFNLFFKNVIESRSFFIESFAWLVVAEECNLFITQVESDL